MKKRYTFMTAMLLSAVLMSACSNSNPEANSNAESSTQLSAEANSSVPVINQDGSNTSGGENAISIFEDFNTPEEAAKCAGFEMVVPDKIEGYTNRYIQAVKNEMIQVIYDDSNAENSITIRKSSKVEDNMLSGDYSEYANQKEIEVEGVKVSLKGNEEGSVSLATWINGSYSYSFGLSKAMPEDKLIEIVKGIK